MNVEQLFIRVYDELCAKVISRDAYEVLHISALLRKMFIDDHPLLHQANATHHKNIKFKILDHDLIDEPNFDSSNAVVGEGVMVFDWKNLDPSIAHNPMRYIDLDANDFQNEAEIIDHVGKVVHGHVFNEVNAMRIRMWYNANTSELITQPVPYEYLAFLVASGRPVPTKELKIQPFLKHKCLILYDHSFSVREVIKASANIKGGVHVGKPRVKKEEELLDFDDVTKMAGMDASLALLIGICNIAIDGLTPLYNQIKMNADEMSV